MAMVLTHEEYLALSGDAKRYRDQRDQLREALNFMVAQFGIHDCPAVRQACTALKATEDAP